MDPRRKDGHQSGGSWGAIGVSGRPCPRLVWHWPRDLWPERPVSLGTYVMRFFEAEKIFTPHKTPEPQERSSVPLCPELENRLPGGASSGCHIHLSLSLLFFPPPGLLWFLELPFHKSEMRDNLKL